MSLYCSFGFDYIKKKRGKEPMYKLDVIQRGAGGCQLCFGCCQPWGPQGRDKRGPWAGAASSG